MRVRIGCGHSFDYSIRGALMKKQALRKVMMCVALCLLSTSCAIKPHQTPQPSPYAAPASPHPYADGGNGRGGGGGTPPLPAANVPSPVAAMPPSATYAPEIRVGLLLPLTGKSASLGQAMLDAAMLGLFDKYAAHPKGSGAPRIMLLPKDTGDDSKQAVKAAQAALDEGAAVLLGPLFSDAVQAVAPLAAKKGVNVISFSNNRSVAGNNSFLFGFLPEEQVTRVMEVATTTKKRQHIAALLPANAYGVVVAETMQDYADIHGLKLAGVGRYPPEITDVTPFIQQLKQGGGEEKRIIDALFLAETGEKLTAMVERLRVQELGNESVTYLGTGLWDDPSLLANPAMVGNLFASSPLQSYQNFVARFEHANGYTPPRLASLGYDIVALAATLAESGGFGAENIRHPSGFEGPANGIFRFRRDGTVERGLSVLSFTPKGKTEISAAPRMFY
jgi:branched-chain amino acid transport system substrate-binding protein